MSLQNQPTSGGPETRKFLFDRAFDTEKGRAAPPPNPAEDAKRKQEADFAKAVQDARESGYRDGYAAAETARINDINSQILGLLQTVTNRLATIESDVAAQNKRRQNGIALAALEIARKLLPEYTKQGALTEIEAAIRTALQDMAHESRLVVRVPDTALDAIESRLKSLTDAAAYQGKLILLADPHLAESDCRIEWADGGLERNARQIWSDIDKTAQLYSPEETTR
jgi:flagellar assembly protein FliH